jgi:hypothetical protein
VPKTVEDRYPAIAALGFSPHSGWAALVALGGDPRSPVVLARERIEMADPAIGGAKQPYHEAEGMAIEKAEALLKLCFDSARRMASEAVGPVVARIRQQGYEVRRSGILQSSGRQGKTLEATLASHALIHTADGDHFREALRLAGEACGLRVTGVRDRELLPRAATALGSSPEPLKERVVALGRALGPPWGADQKSAALMAWLLLADRGS